MSKEHLFKPGQSGNPKGRPKDKTPATMLRKAIAGDMVDIIATLVTMAKQGDAQAAKILLDRVCPPLRPQALPIEIKPGSNLPETGVNVLSATLSGAVPPDIGSMLIRALAEQARLVELQELDDRLRKLEDSLKNKT